MDIKNLHKENEPYIIEMRRWFHRHPETSLKEEKTSLKIREELDKMGVPYEVLSPNYGVVATIKGGQPGKTLALRADIDALPVQEETGLEFASENQGSMHACGHDSHAAMLLGATKALNEIKDSLKGTIKCVFQVAEETGFGFQEVLDYFESIGGVDGVIGLHIWSAIPEGQIMLIPREVFAGAIGFIVEIEGRGGHGARPDLAIDPIKPACDLVLKLASIPSNYYDVLDYSVVNTGMIQAGTLGNIVPEKASINGGLRYYKPEGGERMLEILNRMTRGVSETYGVKSKVIIRGGVPPVKNNPEMIAQAIELLPNIEGLRLADQTEPICASDNYGYLLEAYPGFYGILGGGKHGEEVYPQHHPKFDVDESALRKGSEFMTQFAVNFLK